MKLDALALPALALAVLTAFALSEQAVKPPAKKERVKVTYWEKWTGFEGDGIRRSVEMFNASQDRIHVELLTVSNIDNKCLLAIAGGIPPDIAGLWGTNVAQYADDAALTPLDELCAEFGVTEDMYIPAYWEIGRYRGKTYALCSTPASTALHYNTEILAQAGFKEPPRTIEEMTEMGDKITVRNPNGTIKVAGFLPAEPGWWNWGWGNIFGGRLWDGEKTITSDMPENVRAFTWVQSFAKKYGPAELQTFKSGFGNFSSPQNAFMTRKVAMEIQGVWMYNFISQYEKDLPWAASPFPHPADRPDLAESAFVDMDTLVIPRGAKHPREAFEFIAWLQKQKNMEELCLSHRKNTPLREVSEDFWKRHPNPYIRLFDKLARSKNAYPPPKLAIWPELVAEMNNCFDEVSLLKSTPEAALKKVRLRMQPKLDQNIAREANRAKLEAKR